MQRACVASHAASQPCVIFCRETNKNLAWVASHVALHLLKNGLNSWRNGIYQDHTILWATAHTRIKENGDNATRPRV
jgi:hypothetical protein